ncbi:13292_t:CDS:1, partial [Dentiscutata heterogama]
LEAVLAQKDKSYKEYIVAYASQRLSKTKHNYLALKVECLAIVWAIEHFYYYLEASTLL